MLYLPNVPGRALTMTPADARMDYEDVSIETADGGDIARAGSSRGDPLVCCSSFTVTPETSPIVWTRYDSSGTWIYQC